MIKPPLFDSAAGVSQFVPGQRKSELPLSGGISMGSIVKGLAAFCLMISWQTVPARADYHPGVFKDTRPPIDRIDRIELFAPLASRPIVSLRPSELKENKRDKFAGAAFVFFAYDKIARGISGRAKVYINEGGQERIVKTNFTVVAGGAIEIDGSAFETSIAVAEVEQSQRETGAPESQIGNPRLSGNDAEDATDAPGNSSTRSASPDLRSQSERSVGKRLAAPDIKSGPRFTILAGPAYINKEMTSARIGRFVRTDGEELDVVASDAEVHTAGPLVGAAVDFGRTEFSGRYYWGSGSFNDQGQVQPGTAMVNVDYLGLSPGGAQSQSLGLMGLDAAISSDFKYRRAIFALDRDLDFLLKEMPSLTAVAGLQVAYGTFRHSWLSSLTTPGNLGIQQDRTGEQKNREIGAGFNITLVADPRHGKQKRVKLYATVTFEALHKDAEVNIDEVNICAICGPLDQNFANQVRIHDTFWTWGVGIRGGPLGKSPTG